MLDIEGILIDLSGDTICGNNKEFDTLFLDMEAAQKGKAEREMAGSVIEAEPPDWRLVKKNALTLAKQTHDLRVVVNLINAMLALHGFSGLEESSRLLVGLLEKYWPCLYPELDVDDGDAIARINTLRVLCDRPFYLALKKQPLVEVRGIGCFTLNHIQGKVNSSHEEKAPDAALVNAAFENCDLADLQTMLASVSGSLTNINHINRLLQEKAEEDNTLDFNQIMRTLKEIEKVLSSHLQQRTTADNNGAPTSSMVASTHSQAATQTTNTAASLSEYSAPPPISGEINSADDVLKMLDKINTYYQNYEPSSPVPLLLGRAKRLVNKDFKQLIEDLSPKTLKELEVIFGVDKKKGR